MAKEKLGAKSEGIRLPGEDVDWLHRWQAQNGQPRSSVIRAAVRMLRIVIVDLPELAQVRLIATLAEREPGPKQEEEFWAALTAALAAKKGKKR